MRAKNMIMNKDVKVECIIYEQNNIMGFKFITKTQNIGWRCFETLGTVLIWEIYEDSWTYGCIIFGFLFNFHADYFKLYQIGLWSPNCTRNSPKSPLSTYLIRLIFLKNLLKTFNSSFRSYFYVELLVEFNKHWMWKISSQKIFSQNHF